MSTPRRSSTWTLAGILLALLSVSSTASAQDSEASLRATLEALAGPETRGRAVDTDLDRAASHLEDQLGRLGEVRVREFDGPDGSTLRNLLLLREGEGEGWVVLTAHYDHLGLGEPGTPHHGKVHFGADDNASGVAVLLEVARVLQDYPAAERGVVFALLSGEEIGLLGAEHFVEDPPVALDTVEAVINLDTVGHLDEGGLTVFGVESGRGFERILEGLNSAFGLDLKTVPRGSGASDDAVFDRAGIPSLHLFTGAHATYHRPSDTVDTIDVDGLLTLADFTAELVDYLAQADTGIEYVPAGATTVAPDASKATEGRRRVSFGSIPDFQRQGEGVALTGVIPGSPADEAGLQEGDVIVEFGGAPIEDLTDYSEAMKRHQPGDEVEVVFLRGGERLRVTVTLVERS